MGGRLKYPAVTAADSYDISMAVRLLLQSGRRMQSSAARQLGLRVTDVQAMDLVTSAGNTISPAELADELGIRTASASALIDRMVSAGHLKRFSAPRPNRYRTSVEATPHARAEVRETLRDVNDRFRELGTSLTEEEAAVVLGFLKQATQILRDYADGSEHASDRPAPARPSDPESATRPS